MHPFFIAVLFSTWLSFWWQPLEKRMVFGFARGTKTYPSTDVGVVTALSAKLSRSRTQNGDIRNLRPTGQCTAGVPGSEAAVRSDLVELQKMFSCYQEVANANHIQASVIAALASRVSRGGRVIREKQGYGFHGATYGILQCSLETSGLPCEFCPWNSCCHIKMMVSMLLVPYIKQVQSKHPTWSKEMALQGGVAAYNFGVKNVQTWEHLDVGSWNNDFSNDVMARAKYLYKLGWN